MSFLFGGGTTDCHVQPVVVGNEIPEFQAPNIIWQLVKIGPEQYKIEPNIR